MKSLFHLISGHFCIRITIMKLLKILILVISVFSESGLCVDKFGIVNSLLLKLMQSSLPTTPPTQYDPVEDFTKSKNSIIRSLGIWRLKNGDEHTNLAPVTSPVTVVRPPLESVMYYYNYSLAIVCFSSLERWDCPTCKILGGHIQRVKLHFNQQYQTKWMVTVDHQRDEIVLTFRTSYNVANFLLDFDFLTLTKINGSDVAIHARWLTMVLADWDEIVKVLKQVIDWNPTYKLIITGHSLGGSMSAITTFLLKYHNVFPTTQLEQYTYGQPRVGNKAFADFINGLNIPVVRAVNRDDAGAKVPPAYLGYYHHHNELYMDIDQNGNRTARYCSTERYEDPMCGQSRGPIYSLFSLFISFLDHATYYGVDLSICLQSNVPEWLLNFFLPLQQYIPKAIQENIPPFSVYTTALQDLSYLLEGGGIRNLYKIASEQPSTKTGWSNRK